MPTSAIFYLSSELYPLPQLTAAVWDKLLHFLEYGSLQSVSLPLLLQALFERAPNVLVLLCQEGERASGSGGTENGLRLTPDAP